MHLLFATQTHTTTPSTSPAIFDIKFKKAPHFCDAFNRVHFSIIKQCKRQHSHHRLCCLSLLSYSVFVFSVKDIPLLGGAFFCHCEGRKARGNLPGKRHSRRSPRQGFALPRDDISGRRCGGSEPPALQKKPTRSHCHPERSAAEPKDPYYPIEENGFFAALRRTP